MNVLMLAPEFLPTWGGVGVYIAEIAKNMPHDVEVHIITPSRIQFEHNIIKENRIDNHRFPSNVHIHYLGTARENFFYNLNFQVNCFRTVPQFVKENDIDLIHSQSAMPDLLLSPQKVKIPIITTIHTTIEGQLRTISKTDRSFRELDSSEKMTKLFGTFLKLIENSYYQKGRHFITVSQWGKKAIIAEKKIGPDRITVIHNGVDTTMFTPEMREESKNYYPDFIDIDSLKILYLSRLISSKGINCLINAIPNILKAIDAYFVIAGPGKQIIMGDFLKENYSYLGYVPHERTPFLYSSMDTFILPSFSENFPLSVLEAMASENAVVASNVGGIPEMIQSHENGLLIPPNDPESIARAIIMLGENTTLMEKLSRNARTSVLEKFTWKKAAQETKNYYEKVLTNENPAD